ncbi:hypothetical protein L9F63_011348, partial [Diploptera punctata]
IPKIDLQNGEVSASFGGYSASAGLGGVLSGGPAGGLHAEAGTPDGTRASAGLGGSVADGPVGGLHAEAGTSGGAGASAGLGGKVGTGGYAGADSSASSSGSAVGNRVYVPQKPRQRPPDFYDNIFNIPISVLQAVNQLLGGAPVKHASGGAGIQSRTSSSSASAGSQATSGTFSAGTSVQAGGGGANKGGGFFDQIFNIPISALKSVNQFLNTKNQAAG